MEVACLCFLPNSCLDTSSFCNTHAHTHTCMHAHTHAHAHACTHACTGTHTHTLIHSCTCPPTLTHTYIHTLTLQHPLYPPMKLYFTSAFFICFVNEHVHIYTQNHRKLNRYKYCILLQNILRGKLSGQKI